MLDLQQLRIKIRLQCDKLTHPTIYLEYTVFQRIEALAAGMDPAAPFRFMMSRGSGEDARGDSLIGSAGRLQSRFQFLQSDFTLRISESKSAESVRTESNQGESAAANQFFHLRINFSINNAKRQLVSNLKLHGQRAVVPCRGTCADWRPVHRICTSSDAKNGNLRFWKRISSCESIFASANQFFRQQCKTATGFKFEGTRAGSSGSMPWNLF